MGQDRLLLDHVEDDGVGSRLGHQRGNDKGSDTGSIDHPAGQRIPGYRAGAFDHDCPIEGALQSGVETVEHVGQGGFVNSGDERQGLSCRILVPHPGRLDHRSRCSALESTVQDRVLVEIEPDRGGNQSETPVTHQDRNRCGGHAALQVSQRGQGVVDGGIALFGSRDRPRRNLPAVVVESLDQQEAKAEHH